ncbi:Bromodomain-containing protein, partial [Ramicandelaber brevisporus]
HIPQNQYRYLAAIINQLKRHRDAGPFLKPVDIVALSIPEYPNIIKNPMDLGTAEDKLTSNQYYNADEVLADIRLIFNNCYKFNGRDSPVSKMAATLERSFNQQLHNLPRVGDTGGSPGAANDFAGNGVGSSAAGTGGGGGSGTDARGRRITQTPSNRYEAAVATPVNKKGRASDPQLKFCGVMIRDFFKRNHNPYALPFHYPVDWRAMNIPDYPFVVKKPMDMSTMRKKIEERHYADASEFEADFRLMLNNCFTYNPPGNPVHQFGRQLEAVFNEKWKDLPPKLEPPPPPAPLPTPTATVAASGGGAKRGGAAQRRLSDVSSDTPQAKPNKNRAKSPRGRDAAGGAMSGDDGHEPTTKPRKRAATQPAELPELPIDKKNALSVNLGDLDEEKMNGVVEIISRLQPELINGEEEVELDIDNCSNNTLWHLHSYVTGEPL